MTTPRLTIVVTPRERHTLVLEALDALDAHTREPFDLMVIDLGGPRRLLGRVRARLAGRPGTEVIALGRCVPLEAVGRVAPRIRTRFTFLMDNDVLVHPGWCEPLLALAEAGARIVSPAILEMDRPDHGGRERTHFLAGDLHVRRGAGGARLEEQGRHRGLPLEDLPREPVEGDLLEMHAVLLETALLKRLDLPPLTVREHVEVVLQAKALGAGVVSTAQSVVRYDNLHARMSFADLSFFRYRWSPEATRRSSELFERRWGQRFEDVAGFVAWQGRRQRYVTARALGVPSKWANRISRWLARRRYGATPSEARRDAVVSRWFDELPGGVPARRDGGAARVLGPVPIPAGAL